MPSALIAETIGHPSVQLLRSFFGYLGFTPDGTRILHSCRHGIRIWDLSLQELIDIPITDDPVSWAKLLDGRIVVSCSWDEWSYDFWDTTSGTPIRFCTASHRGGPFGRLPDLYDFTDLASAPDDLTAQRWERITRDTDQWKEDPRWSNEMHNLMLQVIEGAILVLEESSDTRIANLYVGPRVKDVVLLPSGKSVSFELHGSDESYLWIIGTQTVYRLDASFLVHQIRSDLYSHATDHYIADQREDDLPFGTPVQAPLCQFSTLVPPSGANGAFLQMDDTLLQLTSMVKLNYGT